MSTRPTDERRSRRPATTRTVAATGICPDCWTHEASLCPDCHAVLGCGTATRGHACAAQAGRAA